MSSISLRSIFQRRARLLAAALAVPLVLAAAPLRGGVGAPVVFVTSTSGNGNFGSAGTWPETEGSGNTGFAAADEICQERAALAGLDGGGSIAFRAWVAIGTTDAYCHVSGLTGNKGNNCNTQELSPSPGPYYRTDGVPFIDRLSDVVGGIRSAASRSETGAFVTSLAWTGSNVDGTATASTCGGWTLDSGFGSIGSTTSEQYWSELALDGTLGCGNAAHLYCFQNPAVAPARAAWPEPAALVFVRTGGGSGSLGGIAGADQTCQDQAAEAGLPGAASFRAWLSDIDFDAKDRYTIDGPWYRADGVRVAASLAALTDGNLDSAISFIPNGAHLSAPDRAWTGTFGGGTGSANHCNSWLAGDAGFSGTSGSTDETGNSWTSTADFSPDTCNDTGRFYCFGDIIVVFWDGFESHNPSRWSSSAGYVP